jgi:glycosyltransferase involved in cell wall biosynthesis
MRTDRYDIAFYIPSLSPLLVGSGSTGGAETQVLLLSRELVALGLRVCLVVFDLPDNDIPSSLDGVDVVVRPPYPPHQPLVRKAAEANRVWRTVKTVEAEVFVTRTSGPHVGLVGMSAKLCRRRFVYSTAHVNDFDPTHSLHNRRDQWLYRLGIRLADSIVVQTEEQVGLCERAFGKEPVLIKSVVEPAPLNERVPEAFLWVGRLVRGKRPLEFVELARRMPEVPFRMVAVAEDGNLAQDVARAAEQVRNLELLSSRPRHEVLGLIDRAVAVVNTADNEGMPNVFLEGWSRGVPALALSHDPGGVIETHGIGSFARGSPQRLAAAADELWRSRFDGGRLSERCRSYVLAQHSGPQIAAQWVEAVKVGQARTPTGTRAA